MLSSFIDKKTSFPLAAFMSLCREEVIGIASYFIFAAMVQPCLVCCVHSVEQALLLVPGGEMQGRLCSPQDQ